MKAAKEHKPQQSRVIQCSNNCNRNIINTIQRQISENNYNQAKSILVQAGSKSAEKSHNKHNRSDGVPANHGIQLLQEARDEFRSIDIESKNEIFKAGMTKEHYDAIHAAAKKMGITKW